MGIWDWIADKGEKYPTALRRITAMIFTMLLAYCILGYFGSFLAEQGRDGCERGNAARLADLREASGLLTNSKVKRVIYEAHGEKELARSEEEREDVFIKKIGNLEGIAEGSGHANAPEGVTISCVEDWPKPIPWFEGTGE